MKIFLMINYKVIEVSRKVYLKIKLELPNIYKEYMMIY